MTNNYSVPADVKSKADDTPIVPVIAENDIMKFFNLEKNDIQDFSITHAKDGISIHIRLNAKPHICPVCRQKSQRVKDYVKKRITHSVLNGEKCYIIYEARRYQCPHCKKIFYETNPFTIGNSRLSIATVYNILRDLKSPTETFTSVANRYGVSVTTAINIFDRNIHISRRQLPECLGIDEVYAFKSHDSSYVCVLVDCENGHVVDILPSRKKDYLEKYFSAIPLSERQRVKYVSFDMWGTYRLVSKLYLPNAKCICDHFHVIQELNRCVNRVRIDTQNKYYSVIKKYDKKDKNDLTNEELDLLDNANKHYYVLKKFHWMLTSNDKDNIIFEPNVEKRFNRVLNGYYNYYDLYNFMVKDDPEIDAAYDLKYEVQEFYAKCKHKDAKGRLEEIIIDFRSCPIEAMSKFANTLSKWKYEIIDSFIIVNNDTKKKMNTAIVENRNKTIKLIKHSSNGFLNYERFRNRVLFALNKDELININVTDGRLYK